MTQQNDAKKQEAQQGTDDSVKKEFKKHPGTRTMEQVEKADTGNSIANPDAARGSAADGDTASS